MSRNQRLALKISYVLALGTVLQATTCQLLPAQADSAATSLSAAGDALLTFIQDLARQALSAAVL